jgi:hypothetical protein
MTAPRQSKPVAGRFFEDFRIGERLRHATPGALREGDASLYTALCGTRFAVQSADSFARAKERERIGALRVRTIATTNRPCADFPLREGEGYEPHVALDLDYWAILPR